MVHQKIPIFCLLRTLACDLGLLWDLLGMGNAESVKKQRIDHASKTGVLSMENLKLQKVRGPADAPFFLCTATQVQLPY